MFRPVWLLTCVLLAGAIAYGADNDNSAKKKKTPEPLLRPGMEWAGTFTRTSPGKANDFRINKQFRGTVADACRFWITRVEGNSFAGNLRFGPTEFEFEGMLTRGTAFQLRFTKMLRGGSILAGGSMVGEFGPNAETIRGTAGQPATGRAGLLEGTLNKTSGGLKGEPSEDKARKKAKER